MAGLVLPQARHLLRFTSGPGKKVQDSAALVREQVEKAPDRRATDRLDPADSEATETLGP
jgi:hypothetical protein